MSFSLRERTWVHDYRPYSIVSGYRLCLVASIIDSQSSWKSKAEEEVRMAAPTPQRTASGDLLKEAALSSKLNLVRSFYLKNFPKISNHI